MTTDRELARRRLRAQLLSAPVADAEQVVRTLLGVQAENPSQSAWAVATRTANPDQEDLAHALADGRILRLHILRSTWHYVLAEDVAWLQHLTAPRVRPTIDQQLRPFADRLPRLRGMIEDVLGEASARTRGELASAFAERGEVLTGQQLMLLLAHLELDGLVCSGAPRDGEHTYALLARRVPSPRRLERDEALAELARRYFTSHGPATERDLAYWATLTVTDVRRGIAGAGDALASFEHDGRTYVFGPQAAAAASATGEDPGAAVSGGPQQAPGATAHLLQVLDEMYRGYQDSRWVIDADGIVPRVREAAIGMALVDGQLVASMKRAIGKGVVTFTIRPYRRLRDREVGAIEDAAARYAAFLGVLPRVDLAAVG